MAKRFKHKQSLDAQNSLFNESELDQIAGAQKETGPVTVLGMTFADDDERRAYFREQLRAKLPEMRNIEGFPIGSDDDIVNLSDPPYYTACPNAWLNDFIAEWEQEKIRLEAEGKRLLTSKSPNRMPMVLKWAKIVQFTMHTHITQKSRMS